MAKPKVEEIKKVDDKTTKPATDIKKPDEKKIEVVAPKVVNPSVAASKPAVEEKPKVVA